MAIWQFQIIFPLIYSPLFLFTIGSLVSAGLRPEGAGVSLIPQSEAGGNLGPTRPLCMIDHLPPFFMISGLRYLRRKPSILFPHPDIPTSLLPSSRM